MSDEFPVASGVTMLMLSRGRPRSETPLASSVTVRLPTVLHDRLITQASEAQTSVASLVREWLVVRLR